MKLATVKDGTRDGCLVVVSRDLTLAVVVADIATTMQDAIDNWKLCKTALQDRYHQLNRGDITQTLPFAEQHIAAPLPRAFQWADGSAYVNHVELVRKARGAEMPADFWTDPLMYQGGSDHFLGPFDDIPIENIEWGVDF